MSDETPRTEPIDETPKDDKFTPPLEPISAKNTPVFVSKTDESWGVDRNLQVRRLGPRQPWMCSAHLSDGSGRLCTKAKAHGSEVCETHGAGSSLVKAAAQRRFEELVPTAQQAVTELLSGDHAPSKLGAAREVFDRALGPVRGADKAASGVQIAIGLMGHPQLAIAVSNAQDDPESDQVIDVEGDSDPEDEP